jgi:hypothetical protein
MAKNVLTDNFIQPLNGAAAARVDIHAGDGNLAVDRLAGSNAVLASGSLQYLEGQDLPARTLVSGNGQEILTLKGSVDRRPRFHFPWSACNGATQWQVHLNPTIPLDISARSNGGNLKLDLTGLCILGISAETGGGNIDVVLPDCSANFDVNARTGVGNVSVSIPTGIAARIHVTTGLGKAIVDPRFSLTDKNTYQSPDFDFADDKIEISMSSGAGNVIVNTPRV